MSTIGKVLVFLVLVLSIAFLASSIFVLGKEENWRTKFDNEVAARKKDNDEKTAKISELESQLGQSKQTANNKDTQIASLTNEKDQLGSRLKDADNFKASVSENISKISADLDNYRKLTDELTKKLDDASKDAQAARDARDAAKKAQDDAENKLSQSEEASKQLTGQVNSLLASVKKLTEENTTKDNALSVYAEKTGIPLGEVYLAPPSIAGNVVNVALDAKLIQLNVGTDANVKKGYSFTVYRGSEYKGEAIVEDVQAKFATARIKTMVRPITVGDQVRSGVL